MPTALGGFLKLSDAMTPSENVEQIVSQLRDFVNKSEKRIRHIAQATDLADQTINRVIGVANTENKYSSSLPTIAALADYFGLEVRLVPKGSK